ncbi:ribosomal protein S2, flavodoxin-like domain-containing protein [Schizophyllum commune]
MLRSRVPSTSRAASTVFKRGVQLASQHPPLKTEADWTQLQYDRAYVSQLKNVFDKQGPVLTEDSKWRLRDSLNRPPQEATISALLAAGAHFGHSTSRLNPNFMPYAYGTRGGITIIDLDHTLPLLRRATQFARSVAYRGGQILFLGTRPDLRPVVQKAAERLGPGNGYYIADRWLPGTLTNRFSMLNPDDFKRYNLLPDLVVLLNPIQNAVAIRELAVEHVPTIGIIDSNADPRLVMYPIPANDESTRVAEIIAGVISIAAREGVHLREREAADVARKRLADDAGKSEEESDLSATQREELENLIRRVDSRTMVEEHGEDPVTRRPKSEAEILSYRNRPVKKDEPPSAPAQKLVEYAGILRLQETFYPSELHEPLQKFATFLESVAWETGGYSLDFQKSLDMAIERFVQTHPEEAKSLLGAPSPESTDST